MSLDLALLGPITQVVWIDLLLSADNAVVIALACRSLPDAQRRIGMVLGIAAAITLRVLFAFVAVEVLEVPFLKLAAGLVLIYLGIKLACDDGHGRADVPAARNLWAAVWTIGVADAIMSLDNVLALLAAARQNLAVFAFGILLSIPLIVWGSALITPLLRHFPILAVGGGALLGWVAGELIAQDAMVGPLLQ
ncbi:MAG: TerC family protein, partial [Hyphomicrobiales bacterium]|nr:TerC family protein [Hyphomicrobiales bacterium]